MRLIFNSYSKELSHFYPELKIEHHPYDVITIVREHNTKEKT